ncbi:neural/ectodermal development factor IMP-L2-like protein, partial [Dinothrombium tinctorium]
NVAEANHTEKRSSESVRVGSKLFFDCPKPKDSGRYTCLANNSKYQVISTFDLIVEEAGKIATNQNVSLCELKKNGSSPARINLWTQVMFAMIGSDVKLNCRSSGNPKPSVTWFKSNICDESRSDEQILIENSDKYTIEENGDLIIKNMKWTDVNEYHCFVENQYNSEVTTAVVYPIAPETTHS